MEYYKKYVQFGDIVFDESEMLGDYDGVNISVKTDSYEYSHIHGAYEPLKREQQLIKPISISMNIRLHLLKINEAYRESYIDFVKSELLKKKPLWCIQGTRLLYAMARCTSINEIVKEVQDYLEFDLEFSLYEGYFHIAEPRTIFFVDYNSCFPLRDEEICNGGMCSNCVTKPIYKNLNCCEDCKDYISQDNEMWYNCNWYNKYYNLACEPLGFKIVYDDTFDNKAGNILFPQDNCGNEITGRVCITSPVDTDEIYIEIYGNCINDVMIDINGNINQILGEYKGILKIYSDGSVYNGDTLLPSSVWQTSGTNEYGWTLKNGYNNIKIYSSDMKKVRILVDERTY